MPNNAPDVIFFIGAGFSRPAQVPTMPEFVQIFEDEIKKISGNHEKYYFAVKHTMAQVEGKNEAHYIPDLETLMNILHKLEKGQTLETAAWAEKNSIGKFGHDIRAQVQYELKKLIKDKCTIDPSSSNLTYLNPLCKFFSSSNPIDIFSVNYDDVVDVFCRQNNYRMEDGFGQDWEPNRFQSKNVHVNLFKLHGSVLWYKTDRGAFHKIPFKIPEGSKDLLLNETLNSLIVYPVAGKPIHFEPLAYAMHRFRERLKEVDQCFVIGYSMRDKHIQDIFTESLRRNPKLKIVIADPEPFKIIKEITNDALKRAIIPAAFYVQELLKNGRLIQLRGNIHSLPDPARSYSLKAAQDYFKALDYESAMKIIPPKDLKKYYDAIQLNDMSYTIILGGLYYIQVVAKYTNNPSLENELRETVKDLLRSIAKKINWKSEPGYFLKRTKQSIDWVVDNLKGRVSDTVSEFTHHKIGVLKYGLEELGNYKNEDEIKKFISETCLSLIKWTNEQIYLDRKQHTWLFK